MLYVPRGFVQRTGGTVEPRLHVVAKTVPKGNVLRRSVGRSHKMTVGSWNKSAVVWANGGNTGLEYTRSWSGEDDPTQLKIRRQKYSIYRVVSRGNGIWRNSTYLKKFTYLVPLTATQAGDVSRKRIRQNEHPYTMNSFICKCDIAYMVPAMSNAPWSAFYSSMTGIPYSSPRSLFTANDEIRLVNKLREKMQGSDFNMSVFLGEGHQTVKMLGDSAIRIAKAGYFAKRGDVRGAARALFEGTSRGPLNKRHQWDPASRSDNRFLNFKSDARNTANIWLEIQYGWRPLISDAESSAQALAHHLSVPAQTTYRAKIKRGVIDTGTNPYPGGPANYGYIWQKMHVGHQRNIKAILTETPSIYAKLGLLDPELVAWELLPFSFVADWFIPISQWMEARALSSRLRGTFVYSDKQTLYSDAKDTVIVKGAKGNLYRTPFPQPQMKFSKVKFTRTISTVLKVPKPEMKPLSKVASWQHCANAIALMTQIFTKPGVNLSPKQRGMLTNSPAIFPEHYWSK